MECDERFGACPVVAQRVNLVAGTQVGFRA